MGGACLGMCRTGGTDEVFVYVHARTQLHTSARNRWAPNRGLSKIFYTTSNKNA